MAVLLDDGRASGRTGWSLATGATARALPGGAGRGPPPADARRRLGAARRSGAGPAGGRGRRRLHRARGGGHPAVAGAGGDRGGGRRRSAGRTVGGPARRGGVRPARAAAGWTWAAGSVSGLRTGPTGRVARSLARTGPAARRRGRGRDRGRTGRWSWLTGSGLTDPGAACICDASGAHGAARRGRGRGLCARGTTRTWAARTGWSTGPPRFSGRPLAVRALLGGTGPLAAPAARRRTSGPTSTACASSSPAPTRGRRGRRRGGQRRGAQGSSPSTAGPGYRWQCSALDRPRRSPSGAGALGGRGGR